MNQWRSPLGKITIMIAVVLTAAAWSGCGAGDYNFEIVNGYELAGDTPYTWISYPDGGDVGDFAIGELGLEGNIIYGERYTTDMYGAHNGYFIIDTISGEVQEFRLDESDAWMNSLSGLGVLSIDMSWSSAIWGREWIGWLILAFVVAIIVVIVVGIILVVLFVIAPHERKNRQKQLDRL